MCVGLINCSISLAIRLKSEMMASSCKEATKLIQPNICIFQSYLMLWDSYITQLQGFHRHSTIMHIYYQLYSLAPQHGDH